MNDFDFNNKYSEYLKLLDKYVIDMVPETPKLWSVIMDAMKYSLSSGGKRVRPVLTCAFCEALGGNVQDALPFASAIEFMHTYTLIHDDLPCMDNDDFRRGKPSSHKKFGEANALLAGDALLDHSFSCLASSSMRPELIVKALKTLSDNGGINGVIGGQTVDLLGENKKLSLEELILQDSMKTGCLIRCACELGCLAADREDSVLKAVEYGVNLGIAFQIVDDILDFSEGEDSSDIKENKTTYVSAFGLEGAKSEAERYTEKALSDLNEMNLNSDFLKTFTQKLLVRSK